MALISYAQRIADHAARDPEHLAVTDETRSIARGELERLANRIARDARMRWAWCKATSSRSHCRTASSSSPSCVACWKLGGDAAARVVAAAARELDAIVELANPRGRRGRRSRGSSRAAACLPVGRPAPTSTTVRCPTRVANPWKAMTSGGIDRPAEADPRGRSRAHRSRAQPAADDADRRHPHDAGPAVPQRSVRVDDARRCSRAITSCSLARFDAESTLAADRREHPPTRCTWCRR